MHEISGDMLIFELLVKTRIQIKFGVTFTDIHHVFEFLNNTEI